LSGSSAWLLITLIINALDKSNIYFTATGVIAAILLMYCGLTFDKQKRLVTSEVVDETCPKCGNKLVTSEMYCKTCNRSTILHEVKSE